MKLLRYTLLAATVALFATADATAGEENPGDPEQCAKVVSSQLEAFGINMDSVKNVQWKTDNFNHHGANTVSGYRFYGEPPACESGQIAIEMWANCGITDTYTTGECRIKGVPHYWF